MPAQQQTFLEFDMPSEPRPDPAARKPDPAPAPLWLQRLSLVVLVLFCFYIGGLLAVLPWSPRYWTANGWVVSHPAIDSIVQQGWVRGLVSGLGLIDIWIGVSELLHYRDYRG
jgi:hypothetical protein